jgi:hypothetical protein
MHFDTTQSMVECCIALQRQCLMHSYFILSLLHLMNHSRAAARASTRIQVVYAHTVSKSYTPPRLHTHSITARHIRWWDIIGTEQGPLNGCRGALDPLLFDAGWECKIAQVLSCRSLCSWQIPMPHTPGMSEPSAHERV